MTLIYDNTYAGLLTAVFECFRLKAGPETIIRAEADYAEELFATPVVVTTDPAAAKRVRVGLDKRDKEAAQLCYRCFLSEDARREELILHLVRRTVAAGAGVADDITDDRMLLLKRLNQQMGREIHRMHAFVRFQETPDGLYTALVEPDFNVLPLLQPHFVARYPAQDWLIYDTRRHYGLHWDREEAAFITLSSDRHSHLRQLSTDLLANRETDYQTLWQTYFRATDIPERRNLKLHLQHVPKRYWKYLVEKWDGEG